MAILLLLVWIAYPVLIYFSIQRGQPRVIALVAIGVLGLRATLSPRLRRFEHARALALPTLAVCVPLGFAAISNRPLALLLAPAAVSFGLLLAFGRSLCQPVSMVERFARAVAPDLSPAETVYCRRVTAVWCLFFASNGTTAASLALAAGREAWALYTGLISYLLMGMLFAGEFLYRHWRFPRYTGGAAGAVLRRLFPSRPARSA